MTLSLRDYQIDAIEKCKAAFLDHKKIIYVLPTGGGKTVIASTMIKLSLINRKKILFLAHRKEIINQTSSQLNKLGLEHGIIMSGIVPDYNASIQLASIQTLRRRALPPADFIIVDECHLSISKSWIDILEKYPESYILGLTATPIRMDGKGLNNIYTKLVEGVSIKKLMELDYLVPVRHICPVGIKLKGIRKKRGDYDLEMAAERMNMLCGDIVEHYKRYNKKAVCFCCNIDHAENLCNEFKSQGIAADVLTSKDKNRDEKLAAFKRGEIKVLCNVNILSEGWDCPEIEIVIMARPTHSLALYLQQIGRGLRPAFGKKELILLDHANNGYKPNFGFVHDKREWTLQGNAFKNPDNINISTCQECFSAFRGNICPYCHSERVRKKHVPLQFKKVAMQEVEKFPALLDLMRDQYYIYRAIARKRRYADYWPRWALSRKFGKPLSDKFFAAGEHKK